MRQFLVTALLAIITMTTAVAQGRGNRGQARERIHAAKMAYIADRLHLTAGQSGEFIPLYNEYENEVRDIRRSYFKKYKGMDPSEADAATSRQFIDDNLDYQADIIALKRKYNDRFLKVISAQQLVDLHSSEREFRQMLEKKLRDRQLRR